jgi:hypothetical protein
VYGFKPEESSEELATSKGIKGMWIIAGIPKEGLKGIEKQEKQKVALATRTLSAKAIRKQTFYNFISIFKNMNESVIQRGT